ncbi:Mitochondrial amidoxime reducing component 2 [Linum grandiflorum]
MEEEGAVTVSSIFIYPIKSCRGISVPQAPLTPTGFRWDRNWVVVNYKGRAYTQRVEPKLALVEVQLPDEAFIDGWEPTKSSFMGELNLPTPLSLSIILLNSSLFNLIFCSIFVNFPVVKAPGMGALQIPLTKPQDVAEGVSVWEWSGSALDEGPQPAKWFSDYIGKPSRLVRFNAGSEARPVDPEYGRGHNIMFSDLFPYMVASQESLDALNKLLSEPVPINRFRPNMLVNGCEPFSEDLWTEIRINKSTFGGVRMCSRCKVPTINQDTGVIGSEPNATLMQFRSDKVLRPDKKQQGKVYFGQNLVWKDNDSGAGKGNVVKVGDPVVVLQKVSSPAEAAA